MHPFLRETFDDEQSKLAKLNAIPRDLGMSERHVRRALGREIGASPFRLALAQRLTTSAKLLSETRRPITEVAYASGFQSLRRFNSAFREHFEMSPSQWRRQARRA